MSMLAERRERKRYNLVPRGKALYEDPNNFGTRMLEKMGWSKGKGLGANEDGNQDFVRVKYKHDNIGLGYEDRDDGWTQHETNFEDLLKSLHNSEQNSDAEEQDSFPATVGFGFQNGNKTNEDVIAKISGESLEEKSKKSKSRVHYKKFTRGKDLSQYSEKDLANIFGKKSFNCKARSNDLEKVGEIEEENSKESEVTHQFGVTTISSGTSIGDYFKTKMALLKTMKKNKEEKGDNIENIENKEKANEVISEENSEEITENDSLGTGDQEETIAQNFKKIKKSKKSKRKKKCSDEDILEEYVTETVNTVQNSQLEASNQVAETQESISNELPKKKKKKKRDNKDLENADLINFQEVQIETTINSLKHSEKSESNKLSVEVTDIGMGDPLKSRKKSSKKRKNNEICEDQCDSQQSLEDSLNPKSKKRRKNNESYTDEIRECNPCVGKPEDEQKIQNSEEGINLLEVIKPDISEWNKKKSKRKGRNELEAEMTSKDQTDVTDTNDTQKNEEEENADESKAAKKKKKKSKNGKIDSDVIQENTSKGHEIQIQPSSLGCTDLQNSLVSENSNKSDKCVYRINAFKAEQFRHTDINGFVGSNLGEIIGYSLTENMTLEITPSRKDDQNIANMWCYVMDKYKRRMEQENEKKKKKRTVNLKRFKKKKIFHL